jgi:hypothetical protein
MIYDNKHRHAFTLVEIMTVMFGLGVAMSLGTVILAGMLRIQKTSQMSLERTSARSALADQFRTDVAGSRGLMKELGDVRAGESCLILRGNGRCIVYRFQEGRVERQDRSMDGTVLHRALLAPQADRIRFTWDHGNQRLIAMSLEQSADNPHDCRTWVYRAALGGDWQ